LIPSPKQYLDLLVCLNWIGGFGYNTLTLTTSIIYLLMVEEINSISWIGKSQSGQHWFSWPGLRSQNRSISSHQRSPAWPVFPWVPQVWVDLGTSCMSTGKCWSTRSTNKVSSSHMYSLVVLACGPTWPLSESLLIDRCLRRISIRGV